MIQINLADSITPSVCYQNFVINPFNRVVVVVTVVIVVVVTVVIVVVVTVVIVVVVSMFIIIIVL